MTDKTTHFGFTDVSWDEKAAKVAEVFHSVAGKYDLMNDLMSMGIHRVWKRYTIELATVTPGMRILDLAGGTGDLAAKFSRLVGADGQVVLADINASMLQVGRARMADMGLTGNLEHAQVNAECLPFPDNYFDRITIAFGLRNVTDKDAALRSMLRVLKPGGMCMVLEFSKPARALTPLYDTYSFKLLPLLGKLFANDSASYQYLAESIRMHPDQATLQGMMDTAGFVHTDFINLSAGIVALHRGYKA
ncbi:MAG: bifunctional demethylmenaquinone methyltransferase/2-methoxy-6-polyprenyl-1,4-benzoquinol methylase UbiE [Gammaproteobacteria bacterium]